MKLIPFETCNGDMVFINPLAVRCVKRLAACDGPEYVIIVTVGDYESIYGPRLASDAACKLCDKVVAAVNEALSVKEN